MSFIKKLRSYLLSTNDREPSWLPKQIYPDDLFLVSYPKSGNTWLRFILANLLKRSSAEVIDFHSVINHVPEVGKHVAAIEQLERPRVLKSHAPYVPEYPRVVYIVRDARDVYVSYFHYLKSSLPPQMTFADFLRKPDVWPCRWHEHVTSWIDKPNVLVVRYEDTLEAPKSQLLQVLDHWSIRTFSDSRIEQAITASSFDRMKMLEAERGRPYLSDEEREKRSTTFMRQGKSGGWRDIFSKDDEAFLRAEAGVILEQLNYV